MSADQSIEDALAWADRHDPHPTSGGSFFDECRHATVLAAAYRAAIAERDQARGEIKHERDLARIWAHQVDELTERVRGAEADVFVGAKIDTAEVTALIMKLTVRAEAAESRLEIFKATVAPALEKADAAESSLAEARRLGVEALMEKQCELFEARNEAQEWKSKAVIAQGERDVARALAGSIEIQRDEARQQLREAGKDTQFWKDAHDSDVKDLAATIQKYYSQVAALTARIAELEARHIHQKDGVPCVCIECLEGKIEPLQERVKVLTEALEKIAEVDAESNEALQFGCVEIARKALAVGEKI